MSLQVIFMRILIQDLVSSLVIICFIPTAYGGKVGAPLPWQEHELEHVKRSHVESITSGRHEYAIEMAGNVDMDHALTREYARWRVGWQPNESLIIENVGSTLVENCKVIAGGARHGYKRAGQSVSDLAVSAEKSSS